MTSRLLLYKLLKVVVCDSDYSAKLEQSDFSKVYSLSLNQGVAGIAFQGLRKSMKVQGIEKTHLGNNLTIYNKWLGTSGSIILHHDRILHLQNKLSAYLQEVGIRAVVLKGLSIAFYYDDAQLRSFGDLDIYSPADYLRIDEILESISTHFSIDYYRHSECKVDGLMVENHRFLTDVRGQYRFYELEKFLCDEASASLALAPVGGLYYPKECFTFIFFIYHALSHFIYEKLSLKFLVDWCLMLKGRKELTLEVLDEKLKEFGLMRFAVVMTALCIEKLGLQEEYVSKNFLAEIRILDRRLIDRFEEDIFMCDYEKFSTDSLKDRIKRGKAFCKKRWKIKEFLGTSTIIFLLEKFCTLRKYK